MRCPFLVGPRLYLRPFEESDISERYVQWLNDPEVTQYFGFGKFPVTVADARRYLERFKGSTTDLILAIIDRESDQHIGNVTLNRIHWINRTADTGIMIGQKEFWGKGYAFEGWGLLFDYAFQRLGLRKIIAGAVEGHAASLSVLRRLGFQTEGILRDENLLDGEYRDSIRMGLFQEEFYGAIGQKGHAAVGSNPLPNEVGQP